jgi:hypothetical protein
MKHFDCVGIDYLGIDIVDHLINPTMGGDCLCVLAKLRV